MTITLKNADSNVLNILRSLQILKKDLEIIESQNDATLEAINESKAIERDIKNGKRKPYKSWQAAKKALLED